MRHLPKRALLPRKRFRPAFYIAWASSCASVLLAAAPALWGQTKYDPTLAVLTATLIALVWYTYFTFKAVNNEPPTMLDFGFSYQRHPATFSLSIQNQRHHHVACVVAFSVYSTNGDWQLPPPYTGQQADQFVLKPGEAFHGSLPVETLLNSLPPNSRTVLVTARATWNDETGDDGIGGPKSWVVDLENQTVQRLYAESEVELDRERISGSRQT